MEKRFSIRLLENFFCAGSSALLIAIAHQHPEFWYISLVALIPFLWRASRTGLIESMALGGLLAASYCLVTVPLASLTTPGVLLSRFLPLATLFAFYGIAVNRIARHIGFNAIFIAALWLPLEYALNHYAHLGGIFASPPAESAVLIRINSLLGMLMASFVVVLINSLILITLRRVLEELQTLAAFPVEAENRPYAPFKEILLKRKWYYFPNRRAPPLPRRILA